MATLYIHQWEGMAKAADGARMPVPSGFRGSEALVTSASKATSAALSRHTRFVELVSLDGDHVWDDVDCDAASRAKALPQNVLGFYPVAPGGTITAKTV